MESAVFLAVIVVCVILIVIGIVRKRMDLIVNFVLRVLLGFVGIYLVNSLLVQAAVDISVGINGLSTLALGVLGAPGFLLLYGMALYYFFK